MTLSDEEMIAMMKKQYLRIAANEPNAIPDFYVWHTSLPQDERDQLSVFLKENDNENAPWRK